MNSLTAALAYLARGYAPIPIRRGIKRPDDRKGWENERHNEESIRSWVPDCNVGLLLGEPSGNLVDVDLDVPEAVRLAPMFLPATAMLSGRATSLRSHWWYRSPIEKTVKFRDVADEVSKTAGKGMLLEVRFTGAQTVMPPSLHPSGEAYVFDGGVSAPGPEPANAEPDGLLRSASELAAACSLGRRWPSVGTRHEAHLALAGMILMGGGDQVLARRMVTAVATLTGGDLDLHTKAVGDTATKLAAGEHVTGGTALAGHLRGDGSKAVQRVRQWLGLKAEAVTVQSTTEAPALSDEDLALQFVAQHEQRLRFVAEWSQWFGWTGSRWEPLRKLEEFTLSRKLCREASRGIKQLSAAQKVASSARVNAVVSLARSDTRVSVGRESLDRDPWLLNTPKGVIDLTTGELRAHRLDDLCTKEAAVGPGGECPRWRQFLDEICASDDELMDYLQRVAGYCLTGDVREHAFFFFYGSGGNGKGVFVDTVRDILGTYGKVAGIESFLETKHPQHPTDMASLVGARMVSTSEPSSGVTWDEGKVKRVTGGAPISARFMRKDFFEYMPEWKLIVEANNQPKFRKIDSAVERRLHLVPFKVEFGKERPMDKTLKERLKAEWTGILSWAVDGCLAWRERGLDQPKTVRRETSAYLEQEDVLGQWMQERLTMEIGVRETYARLWDDFSAWLQRNGIRDWSKRRMSSELKQIGFPEVKVGSDHKGLGGLCLKLDRVSH